jgi:hypothetical protein
MFMQHRRTNNNAEGSITVHNLKWSSVLCFYYWLFTD